MSSLPFDEDEEETPNEGDTIASASDDVDAPLATEGGSDDIRGEILKAQFGDDE